MTILNIFTDSFVLHTNANFYTGKTERTLSAIHAYSDYKTHFYNAEYLEGFEDDGKLLTDMKYSTPFEYSGEANEGWVGIKSIDGNDFKVTVDIDFGFYAKGITTFIARCYKRDENSIGFPISVDFYVSNNGNNYKYVGEGITRTDLTLASTTTNYRHINESELNGRYVRTVFECRGEDILYLNEICIGAEGELFYANYSEDEIIKDDQGIIYRIAGGNAEVIGIDAEEHIDNGEITPSGVSFNEDGIEYILGAESDNPVTVYSDFMDEGIEKYSGMPNSINYIVIHNTATTSEDTDAVRYNEVLHEDKGTSSWHYTVDENVIYHSLPDSIVGWHAGPSHNHESIGIEMCVNGAPAISSEDFIFEGEIYENWVDNRFRKTIKNTAILTAELLIRYGLTTDKVIQHYDVTEKNCPQWLRANGENDYEGVLWLEFMGYVEDYYAKMNGNNERPNLSPKRNVIIPDYIRIFGGEVYPVTSVCENAFAENAVWLESIEFGANISNIGENCFGEAENLKEIRINIKNDNFRVDSENVLYNKKGDIIFDPNGDDIIPPKQSEWCNLDILQLGNRYCVYIKNEGYTVDDIELEYGKSIKNAKNAKGNALLGESVIGTDTVIEFEDGAKLYFIARGDADGDAQISAMDYILTKRIYYGTYLPTKRQLAAVALTNGNDVVSMDYILIKRHCFDTFDIMG